MAVFSTEPYRIRLDGRWSLEDFGTFPHEYLLVYAVCSHLVGLEIVGRPTPELLEFEVPLKNAQLTRSEEWRLKHPWAGGYSAVNFYSGLIHNLERPARPRVVAIQYASPGYIDLALWLTAAHVARRIIINVTRSLKELNSAYNEIHKGLHERKLLSVDVRTKELELSREELRFIVEAQSEMARLMGLTDQEMRAMRLLGPDAAASRVSELGALKVLLSFVRRLRNLAKFVQKGKAEF